MILSQAVWLLLLMSLSKNQRYQPSRWVHKWKKGAHLTQAPVRSWPPGASERVLSASSKKTQSGNKEYNWPQRRTRGETQSASSRPSVSLRCQRAGREKAEQKIKKYNKLKSLFFFLSPSRPPQKSKRNQEVVRRRGIALRKLAKI